MGSDYSQKPRQKFDKVEIDIGRGTFAAGQLYVALSRCTSFEGLSLTRAVSLKSVMVDERINDFLCNYCEDTAMPPVSKMLDLQIAIRDNQKLKLVYCKTDGKNYKRDVIPQEIRQDFLIAECQERKSLRSFEIRRIVNILSL